MERRPHNRRKMGHRMQHMWDHILDIHQWRRINEWDREQEHGRVARRVG